MAAEAKDQQIWDGTADDLELWGEDATPPGGSEGAAAYFLRMMMEADHVS